AVHKKTLGHYFVWEGDREVVCTISSLLRRQLIYPIADPGSLRPVVVGVKDIREVDPVAVGDNVSFVEADDGTGVITEVAPRRTKLSRRAAGAKPIEQVLVANADQVIPMFSAAKPKPKWAMLDRYLVSAEAAGLDAVVSITKLDLADRDALEEEMELYRDIGYRVVLSSTVSGEGVAEMADLLRGKSSVFVGKSGVGKTSLLNAVQPGLGLRVQETGGKTGKGKHTTTNLAMFALDGGGSIVDTPGMREFGLWNVKGAGADTDRTGAKRASTTEGGRPSDLAAFFPEMAAYVGTCQFRADCSHTHEPGCAIKAAVESGAVTQQRYTSFQKMRG
ncbi:ribosome small subunit-dependent GTPase A, partial [Candidatus Poribacteria bacterium]|nr:ribosome small subunit-dependent GTPase A [Candidatus Poribacteria bacterium]